jgi:hypothetical protein
VVFERTGSGILGGPWPKRPAKESEATLVE